MLTKQPEADIKAQLALLETNLNKAASELLAQLPDHVGQLVHSLSKQYRMLLWQYTCGILLAVHLEGRLSEFQLDPAWKQGLRTQTLKCKHCNKDFTPRRINQVYCSNECGLKALDVESNKPTPKHIMDKKPDVLTTTHNTKPVSKSGDSAGWTESLAAA